MEGGRLEPRVDGETTELCGRERSSPKLEDSPRQNLDDNEQESYEIKGLRKRGGTQVGASLQPVDSGVCGIRHEGVGEATKEVPEWAYVHC